MLYANQIIRSFSLLNDKKEVGAYIYADESGHSGKELFGKALYYFQGAILSVGDIEPQIGDVVSKYCEKYSVERLHGFELGEEKITEVCSELLSTLSSVEWQFHYTVIEKQYIAVTKFVDTIFDSAENPAVPPMWYNIELFRHMICLEINNILNRKDLEHCWQAYLNDDISGLLSVAGTVSKKSKKIADRRARQVISDSVKYAQKHPENFTLSAKKGKSAYKKHTPNMVTFSSLLAATHRFCKKNHVGVNALIHDQTDEFKGTMREFHRTFFGFDFEPNTFGVSPSIAPVDYNLGIFDLKSSKHNYGLQVVDLFLWLVQRDVKSDELRTLKEQIMSNADEFMISQERSKLIVAARMHQLNQNPLSIEQYQKAKATQDKLEAQRLRHIGI